MPSATVVALLQQEQAQHSATLAAYQSIEQQYFDCPKALSPPAQFQYITLRNGIHYETGWLAWCTETLATLCALPAQDGHSDG